jgi:hypothetical protein
MILVNYVECRKQTIMPSVVMLSVVIPSVVMLSVMAPCIQPLPESKTQASGLYYKHMTIVNDDSSIIIQ